MQSQVQGTTYDAQGRALNSEGGIVSAEMPDSFVPDFTPDGKRNTGRLTQATIKQIVAQGGSDFTGAAPLNDGRSGGNGPRSVQPVVININGTATRLNVASRADANTLAGLVEQLAQGKGVAAY